MLVQDFLQNSAARRPDKIALVYEDQRLTYSQLDAKTNRLANALIKQGVQRGDRIAIYLHNSVEAVVAIFAALKSGGVFVLINRSTKTDKLHFILDNCRASALFADPRFLEETPSAQLLATVPSLHTVVVCGSSSDQEAALPAPYHPFAPFLGQASALPPPKVNIDLDLACLIYTSGTTGEPKGVMSDHSNVEFAASSIIQYLRNVDTDVVINVLPLSFDYGLYQLLMTFKFEGRLVLESGFAYPAAILTRIEQEQVTGFPGVPTLFAMILQLDLTPFNLSSLRYITNTAASLPPSHIQELRRKFPQSILYSMYGLTETKRTLYLPPELLDSKPGSVGIAIPGTEVWLEDQEGRRLGPDTPGELVVRGRHVMRGYWESPDATAARFKPGPLPAERVCHTGDLFRMDTDGCMYFVGRSDDMIKSRGEKVSPKEIENVLYSLEGVLEAAVIGVPDALLGQAIKAFVVVTDKALGVAQISAHCRIHLEDFMMPKYIEFRDSLPKTSSGKISKKGLT
ncbi:MAG: AMP-binding protein [bacterium]